MRYKNRRKFSDNMYNTFRTRHSILPTMYVLVKTHKIDWDSFNTDSKYDIIDNCKVRPIVSCCGGPTEKLAWIVTSILSPLLKHVPSNLQNIHEHLSILQSIPKEELAGKQFFSADVTSLYTNINVAASVQDLVDMAEEHWEELDTWGLELVDIQKLLEFVLCNPYFTYNGKTYRQLVGLFMGSKPSPLAAIIRVYSYERRSIYSDLSITFYKRYVDDTGSFAANKEEARLIVDRIAKEDPDQYLSWTVDFPEEQGQYIPFLDAEFTVERDGTLHYRFYRKSQKKQITLHFRSHHPENIKKSTVRNFYKTAAICSSSTESHNHSTEIIDRLLVNNGYTNPRLYSKTRVGTTSQGKFDKDTKTAFLSLPYIDEAFSAHVNHYIKTQNLPITVVYRPGTTLHKLFCSSRPYDNPRCTTKKCKLCAVLENHPKLDCTVRNVVYVVKCKICQDLYVGETYRTCHARFSDHIRAAKNPATYPDNAIGKHYGEDHPGMTPSLSFKILQTKLNSTLKRKVVEALFIRELKPAINNKLEGNSIGFLVS